MGYRAHTVTQHRDYGSTVFGDWEEFTMKFVPTAEEDGLEITGNEAEDFFEVDKESLQEFVNNIPDNDEQSKYLYEGDYNTNKDLKRVLQGAIDESNEDWVSLEWF